MYELLVLGLLMHFPLYAYLIADIADQIIGPWERISRGNISVLLRKLEQDACIEPADPSDVPFPSDRSSRVFAITPAGRDRFSRLMVDTTSNQGTYQRLFRIKALHLEFLEPQDQRYLVEHYLTYCQTTLRYLQAEAQDFATDPRKQQQLSDPFRLVVQEVIALKARQCELEIAWAALLRERIVSAPLSKEESQQ